MESNPIGEPACCEAACDEVGLGTGSASNLQWFAYREHLVRIVFVDLFKHTI